MAIDVFTFAASLRNKEVAKLTVSESISTNRLPSETRITPSEPPNRAPSRREAPHSLSHQERRAVCKHCFGLHQCAFTEEPAFKDYRNDWRS
ncbi:hypothetical protein BaRGS_00004208 [Batillaria attramentaria]|uniref:Uncharacterized protein n=1 Tax=Batillaria attramentaria TaxID=370345 RepID=A0ABD0LYY4_9CAEN